MSDYSCVMYSFFAQKSKIYSIVSWYFVFDENVKPLSWFFLLKYLAYTTWKIKTTKFPLVLVWFCCWYIPWKLLITTYWISRIGIYFILLSALLWDHWSACCPVWRCYAGSKHMISNCKRPIERRRYKGKIWRKSRGACKRWCTGLVEMF